MKRIAALLLALVMLFSLAACGAKDDASAPAAGGTSAGAGSDAPSKENTDNRDVISATPPPADEVKLADTITVLTSDKIPMINTFAGGGGAWAGMVNHLIYDTLIDYTPEGEYLPCLATEWEANDDFTSFTFKLRDDVYYSNGEKFTSDDCMFTLQNGIDNPGSGVFTQIGRKVESFSAPDDTTFCITLKESDYDFWFTISGITSFPVLNREACESDSEKGTWVGTGPYTVVDFSSSEHVTFEAKDSYWGGPAGVTKTIIFKYVAEETAKQILLDNGEADFIDVTGVSIAKYENSADFQLVSFVNEHCCYLGLNTSRPPLDDINLRLAIAYAINAQELIDLACAGYCEPHPTGAIWGYTTMYRNEDIAPREQNIELAKEYLAKSKYNGETLELTVGMAGYYQIAVVALAQLQEIGINAEIFQTDFVTMKNKLEWGNNTVDIAVTNAVLSALPTSIHSSVIPGTWNTAAWTNEEAQALVEKGSNLPYGPEKEEVYKQLQQLIYDDCIYVPTMHYCMYNVVPKGFGGMRIFTNAVYDFSQAYKVIG